MKERILETLVCPSSFGPLELDVRRREQAEILEGFLTAPDGTRYPIIGGVPRMLPPHLKAHLPEDYPDFFRRYPEAYAVVGRSAEEARDVQRHTQDAFGYEWTWADDYHADNFADWLPSGFDARQ